MFKSSKKKLIISGCSYTANYVKTVKLEQFPLWGEILADKLNMELINVSQCGFGNKAIYHTLVETMIETKDVGLVISMWSEFQRVCLFVDESKNKNLNQQPWTSFHPQRTVLDTERDDKFFKLPQVNPKKKSMKYELSKVITNKSLDSLRGVTEQSLGYMFAFQNICENLGIPYLQIQGCAPAVVEDAGRGGAGPAWDRNKKLAEQIIASPYVNKINNRFVGWPISEIIGGYCFDTLLTKHNYRISSQDNHPNEAGHNLISKVLYNEL